MQQAAEVYRPAYIAQPLPEREPVPESNTLESVWAAIVEQCQDDPELCRYLIIHEAKPLAAAVRFLLRGSIDPPE